MPDFNNSLGNDLNIDVSKQIGAPAQNILMQLDRVFMNKFLWCN